MDLNLTKGRIIKLDDSKREYCVIDKVEYQQEFYVILTTVDKPAEVKVCKEIKDNEGIILKEILDTESLKYILRNVKIEDE